MFIDSKTFGKLPIAFQTVLALALVIVGAWIGLNADLLSQGSPSTLLAFYLISALFFVNGVPSLLEGGMTMLYEKKE